jgi:hypothetical protein
MGRAAFDSLTYSSSSRWLFCTRMRSHGCRSFAQVAWYGAWRMDVSTAGCPRNRGTMLRARQCAGSSVFECMVPKMDTDALFPHPHHILAWAQILHVSLHGHGAAHLDAPQF